MKKATGITRRLDKLGRVVIPTELRKSMGINKETPLEIYRNGEEIVITPDDGKQGSGIFRKVDELGRFVLPIELRRSLGIEEKVPVEIFVDGKSIILRKFESGCTFCGNSRGELFRHNGKLICMNCLTSLVRFSGIARRVV